MRYREGRGWGSMPELWADFQDACGSEPPLWTMREFCDRVRDQGGDLEIMTLDGLSALIDQMWSEGEL